MSIIKDDGKVLLIGSQHVYLVDVPNRTVKCIYGGPTRDASAGSDDSDSASGEEEHRDKKQKGSTIQPSLAWTGVGAVLGDHLMLCDSLKGLYLISVKDAERPELLSRTRLEKAATALAIHKSSNDADTFVYVADKFGEVWACSLSDLLDKGKDALHVIAGHISLLTDMIVTEHFILTCDRDEKIRITLRDRPWIIDQFLLEHREYVSRMILLGAEHVVSGGGDKELMLWHWRPGRFAGLKEGDAEFKGQEARSRATLVERIALGCEGDQVDVIGMAACNDVVSVILEGNPSVLHFQFVDGHLRRGEDTRLDNPPSCIAYSGDDLLVGLENGQLLLYRKDSTDPHCLHTIPDPLTKRCSQLRKTVHRLTD